MKKFYLAVSILYGILGIIHTSFTPVFYKAMTEDAMWFAGTGLSLLFLGLLNIASMKLNDKSIFNLCISANIISTIYNILLTVSFGEPEQQAFIGIVLMALMLFGSVYFRIKMTN
jgi:hypothetical protein